MQTVYLLLRHNQQTGPFNLQELLQFTLTPYDLIWIEGKSAGWYYPQEIEALRPHLPFLKAEQQQAAGATIQSMTSKTETSAPKKIFVSMPSVIAVKEETKPQAMTASSFNFEEKVSPFTKPLRPEAAEIKTAYAKPLEALETNYMNWAYQKKTAKKKPLFSKSGLVVLCLLSCALVATWKIANKPKAEETASAAPQQTTIAAQPVSSIPQSNAAQDPSTVQNTIALSSPKKGRVIKNPVAGKVNASIKQATIVKQNQAAKQQPKVPAATDDYAKEGDHKPSPVVTDENIPAAEEKSAPVTTEAPKKKKLRDKIFDIFHKKNPDEKTNEAKPAETDNGSRQSTRREAGSSLTQLVTVKFEIPNSWMMGIKGAKAVFTNKSSETISKAVVEVRYYNEDNDLLDKKTIVFTNVKSKSTQTVSVPEHATATRLEYSVVSAVGAGEAVARL